MVWIHVKATTQFYGLDSEGCVPPIPTGLLFHSIFHLLVTDLNHFQQKLKAAGRVISITQVGFSIRDFVKPRDEALRKRSRLPGIRDRFKDRGSNYWLNRHLHLQR